jgi:multidrug resistance protein
VSFFLPIKSYAPPNLKVNRHSRSGESPELVSLQKGPRDLLYLFDHPCGLHWIQYRLPWNYGDHVRVWRRSSTRYLDLVSIRCRIRVSQGGITRLHAVDAHPLLHSTGPLIFSPLTEIPAIGRNPPYIITLIIFVALQVPTALVHNFAGLLVLRFLAGFFGSPPLATGGASLQDMYNPKTRTFALGVWGLFASAGPALGPVIAGFAAQYKGWRWQFWELLWLSGGALLFLAFTMPETSSENILYRRAQRLRNVTGNKDLKSQGEIEQGNMALKDVASMTLYKPFVLNFTEAMVFANNLFIVSGGNPSGFRILADGTFHRVGIRLRRPLLVLREFPSCLRRNVRNVVVHCRIALLGVVGRCRRRIHRIRLVAQVSRALIALGEDAC